ncbi:2'-5' RNA ligase family protein [Kitasatospora purpeofusca]|uniref:2'-5' RNA ligase family protein n=1 Tax=Kitasatospora purpeofusca TaxID=67352 RepID=A0ABZ1UDV8_9ACTN|nr:2'-5' RNA ligase family protein [Kitasatospora purpeofusca]
MAEDSADGHRAGETGLIIKIPEAEPVVGGWRKEFDSAAAVGIPAHVTVLHPFLPHDRISAQVLAELGELFSAHSAFDIGFESFGRFPGVLHLAPAPEDRLRSLTSAVADRWPEAPPYQGRFADVVPHLTVAYSQDPSVFDEIEADGSDRLPVTARVASVHLLVFDGTVWHERAEFALRG